MTADILLLPERPLAPIGGLESLMTVTSLFIDSAGNIPFFRQDNAHLVKKPDSQCLASDLGGLAVQVSLLQLWFLEPKVGGMLSFP